MLNIYAAKLGWYYYAKMNPVLINIKVFFHLFRMNKNNKSLFIFNILIANMFIYSVVFKLLLSWVNCSCMKLL